MGIHRSILYFSTPDTRLEHLLKLSSVCHTLLHICNSLSYGFIFMHLARWIWLPVLKYSLKDLNLDKVWCEHQQKYRDNYATRISNICNKEEEFHLMISITQKYKSIILYAIRSMKCCNINDIYGHIVSLKTRNFL